MATSHVWESAPSQSFFEGIAQVGFEFDVLTSDRWRCRQHVMLPSPASFMPELPSPGEPRWLREAVSTSLLLLLVAAGRPLADPSQEISEHVSSPLRLMELHLLQEQWRSPEEHGESPYPQRWFKICYTVGACLSIPLPGQKSFDALVEIARGLGTSPQALRDNVLRPEGLLRAAGRSDLPGRQGKKRPLDLPVDDFEKWLVQAARNDVRRNLLEWAPDGPHGRPRPDDDRPWSEVRAKPHQKASGLSLGHAPEDACLSLELEDLVTAWCRQAELTAYEEAVMRLDLQGYADKAIADTLNRSVDGVKQDLREARQKLARIYSSEELKRLMR